MYSEKKFGFVGKNIVNFSAKVITEKLSQAAKVVTAPLFD